MDKRREREIFEGVYNLLKNTRIVDSESPDFIIEDDRLYRLGVEVTELYQDETEAKLRHHPGYVDGLLSGKQAVFRKDKDKISVDKIKLVSDDPEKEDLEINAIIRNILSPQAAVERLFQSIRSKESKVPEYLACCEEVDLIIADVAGLFLIEDMSKF